MNHSIPDAVAIAIRTAQGTLVFSGDYKIDHTPIDGRKMDLARLATLGSEGVLAYFGDSTNSERPGYTPSEKTVGETLDRLIADATGRVIVASFASHLHRISQVIEAAKRHGRLVGVAGRSMIRNVGIARELGYIDLPDSLMVDQKDINNVPDSDIVVLMTGSQGEPLAALSRVASGAHKTIEVGNGDTVIIAAHPIPGNEKGVARTINGLMKRGAHVHYSPLESVHVSGHASAEEQKTMISLLDPQYLVPVHGEFKHQYHHVQTAKAMGISEQNIFMLENGGCVEFYGENQARQLDDVAAGMFLVDGATFGDTSDSIMRERQQLSEDGMFIVVARINSQNGQLLGEPDVISRGFINQQEANGLVGDSIGVVTKTLERTAKKQITDWGDLKTEIRRDLSGFLNQRTQKRPIILPLIVEV